jgi:hypothetical protein
MGNSTNIAGSQVTRPGRLISEPGHITEIASFALPGSETIGACEKPPTPILKSLSVIAMPHTDFEDLTEAIFVFRRPQPFVG